jgi:hypothetical protein
VCTHWFTFLQGKLALTRTAAGGRDAAAAGDASTTEQGDAPTEEDEFDLADLMSEEIEVRGAHVALSNVLVSNSSTAYKQLCK